jgi:hypothetical protein
MGYVFFQGFIGNKEDVFGKKNFEVLKYKLLKRPLAIVPTASVLYICQDHVEKTNLFITLLMYLVS